MLINDPILKDVFDFFEANLGYEEIRDNYLTFMNCLNKLLKSTEVAIIDKIKFLAKDTTIPEDLPILAICEISAVSIPNQKQIDPISVGAKKPAATGNKKPTQPVTVKMSFDPLFYEKAAVVPTNSEKMRILLVNYSFERMLRNNIIDCMNKVTKIEGDLDSIKEEFEEFYHTKFAEPYLANLAEVMKKEKVKYEKVEPVQSTI